MMVRDQPGSLASFQRRWKKMRKWLEAHSDFTIIDCPPSIAIQVRFFLAVADAYIVPAVPDRLSVRGSLLLQGRIRSLGVKIRGLGTLWSLYREQNKIHRKFVDAAAKGSKPLDALPKPFEIIIPNATAIAEAAEPDHDTKTFTAKYSQPFAKLYRSLCEEIVQRTKWHAAQANGVKMAGPSQVTETVGSIGSHQRTANGSRTAPRPRS
jgi:chromosome partitioning protein